MLLATVTLAILIPYYLGLAMEALVSADPAHRVPPLAITVIVLLLIQTLTRSTALIRLYGAASNAEHDLRRALFSRFLALDAGFYRTHRSGDLISRLTNDVSAVAGMWGGGVVWIVAVGALVPFSIIVMARIDWTLTLWALLPLPFVTLGGYRVSRAAHARNRRVQTEISRFTATVQENLSGVGVIKSYRLEEPRALHFEERSTALVRAVLGREIMNGFYGPLFGVFGAISMFAVLGIGGAAVIRGHMRFGELVQFTAYLGLLSSRVVGVGGIVATFQLAYTSWGRLAEVLQRETTISDGDGVPLDTTAISGKIETRDLTIEIEGRTLVDHVSLTMNPGTITAIVGRVGSGKSTLISVIPRLVDAPRGTVFIDGRDVTELPLASLRRAIAYAPQTAFLFSASIAENIAYGIDDEHARADRGRIVEAARRAGLEPDLAALPEGLETQVGERGITLSGGQRQRVALARAIASDRPIVLLDDSLSAVDTETEQRILDHLAEIFAGRTVILISHRVAALRRADQIAVLDGGRLVELGHHDALLANGGVYAELYRAQTMPTVEAA